MTVVIQYANAYFNLKNQDLRSNAFVETKTNIYSVVQHKICTCKIGAMGPIKGKTITGGQKIPEILNE